MRVRTSIFALVVLGVLGVGSALAAPTAGSSYSGKGKEYLNNGPHFETAKSLVASFSFRISQDGTHVVRFRGGYDYYCGAGHGTESARRLGIKSGHFGGTGHSKSRGPNGKVDGTDYFALSGTFIDGGKKARIEYVFNYVSPGHQLRHPYEFKYRTGSCETLVKGTAKVK
jgi:hypothetical protein